MHQIKVLFKNISRYLKKVGDALDSVGRQTGNGPVTFLAHSAGGWLGRVYMLGFGTQGRIQKFVTLGSPHLPPLKVSIARPSYSTIRKRYLTGLGMFIGTNSAVSAIVSQECAPGRV